MRFPGGKAKAFTMSYDDGVEQDIRLIEIMNRFGLKGTFNLNAGLFAPEGTVYPKGQISRRLSAKRALELYREWFMKLWRIDVGWKKCSAVLCEVWLILMAR